MMASPPAPEDMSDESVERKHVQVPSAVRSIHHQPEPDVNKLPKTPALAQGELLSLPMRKRKQEDMQRLLEKLETNTLLSNALPVTPAQSAPSLPVDRPPATSDLPFAPLASPTQQQHDIPIIPSTTHPITVHALTDEMLQDMIQRAREQLLAQQQYPTDSSAPEKASDLVYHIVLLLQQLAVHRGYQPTSHAERKHDYSAPAMQQQQQQQQKDQPQQKPEPRRVYCDGAADEAWMNFAAPKRNTPKYGAIEHKQDATIQEEHKKQQQPQDDLDAFDMLPPHVIQQAITQLRHHTCTAPNTVTNRWCIVWQNVQLKQFLSEKNYDRVVHRHVPKQVQRRALLQHLTPTIRKAYETARVCKCPLDDPQLGMMVARHASRVIMLLRASRASVKQHISHQVTIDPATGLLMPLPCGGQCGQIHIGRFTSALFDMFRTQEPRLPFTATSLRCDAMSGKAWSTEARDWHRRFTIRNRRYAIDIQGVCTILSEHCPTDTWPELQKDANHLWYKYEYRNTNDNQ